MAGKSSKGSGRSIPKIEMNLELSSEKVEELLEKLQDRFEKNVHRHKGLEWARIQARLEAHPEILSSLNAMETTGGEPGVVDYDKKTGEYIFYDSSAQSPKGCRSICYVGEAQEKREKKGVHPVGNAIDRAAAMGIELLTEKEYRALQQLGDFDTKTESWVKTPPDIRELGGTLLCKRRYGHVFVFHNSAPSFYAARGFRSKLRV